MTKEKKYTPQHISDKITQDLIDALLRKGEEFKKETKVLNPYSLEPTQPLFFEAGFKNGVKSAPSATRKLRPASRSMFEVEMMRNVGDEIEVPQIIGSTYTPIKIHGRVGDYYIRTSLLRNLMSEFLYETTFKPCNGGERFVAKFNVDTRLLEGSIFRRK